MRLAPVRPAFALMMGQLQGNAGGFGDAQCFLNALYQRVALIANMGGVEAAGIAGDSGEGRDFLMLGVAAGQIL